MNVAEVEKRQNNRLMVLYKLYCAYCKDTTPYHSIEQIAIDQKMGKDVLIDVYNYLEGESFIDKHGHPRQYLGQISHSGIKAIEWSILNPATRGVHFPAFNELEVE